MAPPKPPTKPPTTPQSNTLLNYFNRSVTKTPKTPTTMTDSPSNNGDGGGSSANQGSSKSIKNGESSKTVTSSRVTKSSPKTPTQTPTQKYDGETPKKSTHGRKTPRRRIQTIESGSDDNEENESPKEEEKEIVTKKKKPTPMSEDDEEEEYTPPNEEDDNEDDEDEGSDDPTDTESEENSGSDDDDEPRSSKRSKKAKSEPKSAGGRMKRKSEDVLAETPRSKKLKTIVGSSPATPSSKMMAKTPAKTPKGGGADSSEDDYGGTDGVPNQWPHLKWEWLKPENRRDSNKRRMSDENYDPTTVDVPMKFLDEQTPVQRQWWELKRKHFDTVLLFKMGKFYELFHMDAVLAIEELDIIFMKGDIAHAGFPEKSYPKYATGLVDKGYKIARIEQTETPEMMGERVKAAKKKGKVSKYMSVVNRELCQVSTPGVRIASAQDNPQIKTKPESKYLYCIYEKLSTAGCPNFGVCFIDTTIGEFHIGQFEDDRYFSRLRTVLSHHSPIQILLQKGNLVLQAEQVINSYVKVRKDVVNWKFASHEVVLKRLKEGNYFYDKPTGDTLWPGVLETITDPGQMTAASGYELGLQAFGAIVSYLKECLVDHDLLSLKRFSIYHPVDTLTIPGPKDVQMPSNMVLDGITLQNLDITESPTPDFNLFSKINTCYTPFGQRLLRQWMCMPLAVPQDIESRLGAIEEMISVVEITKEVTPLLSKLPDLERLLHKIHILGSAHRKQNHPEGRAIMFEEALYSKHKIKDLITTINGFNTCWKIMALLCIQSATSTFLQDLVKQFPDLTTLLNRFKNAFDHSNAEKEGKIIPREGADSEYDDVQSQLQEVMTESEDYLMRIGAKLKAQVKYFGSAKNRFQLEMKEGTKVSSEFEMSSSRKGFKRYMTATTKDFLERVQRIETQREEILRDITRRVFEKFDKSYETWKITVECIAKLDAIISLKTFSQSQTEMCRPKVVSSSKPFLKIKGGRHPCMSVDSYIANSCYLGVSRPNNPAFGTFCLLTGPNMGGKSTLMRQVALIAVLAHMGCYVPATSCEMSVIDRIFTRLGASDNLGDGESTFFVELSEASSVLRHCTKNSLVLMDELGRGTATYDGTAIAYAVATKLAKTGIRTLFSTHYHTLVESIQKLPMIQLGHMACMVENENEGDPTQETVTFLYKLAAGPCPKSYGFNAAKLAGIPDEVIRVGHQKAKEFETSTSNISTFRLIVEAGNKLSLQTAMKLLQI